MDESSPKACDVWVVDFDLGVIPGEPGEGANVRKKGGGGGRVEEREEEGSVTRVGEDDVAIEERPDYVLKM